MRMSKQHQTTASNAPSPRSASEGARASTSNSSLMTALGLAHEPGDPGPLPDWVAEMLGSGEHDAVEIASWPSLLEHTGLELLDVLGLVPPDGGRPEEDASLVAAGLDPELYVGAQRSAYANGQAAHAAISAYYATVHAAEQVFLDRQIDTILRERFGQTEGVTGGRLRPDIVNGDLGSVYEIKPWWWPSSATRAEAELYTGLLMQGLATAGIPAHLFVGDPADRGVNGEVVAGDWWVMFWGADEGAVHYTLFKPESERSVAGAEERRASSLNGATLASSISEWWEENAWWAEPALAAVAVAALMAAIAAVVASSGGWAMLVPLLAL